MQQTLDELMVQLADAWPSVIVSVTAFVCSAEDQSIRVFGTPYGTPERAQEVKAWVSYVGQANGALAVLRLLRPGHHVLEDLAARLIHCPVLMLTGQLLEKKAS